MLRVCLAVWGRAWVQSPVRELRFPHAVSPGCAPMKKVPHDALEKNEGKWVGKNGNFCCSRE